MTTTYICRHCGRPAYSAQQYDFAHHRETGSIACNPGDPDSPTCEAIETPPRCTNCQQPIEWDEAGWWHPHNHEQACDPTQALLARDHAVAEPTT